MHDYYESFFINVGARWKKQKVDYIKITLTFRDKL